MSPPAVAGPSIDNFVSNYHRMFRNYPDSTQLYGSNGRKHSIISPLSDENLTKIYDGQNSPEPLSEKELGTFLHLEKARSCKEVLANYALSLDNTRRLRQGDEVWFFLNGYNTRFPAPFQTKVERIGFTKDKASRLISPAIFNEWIAYRINNSTVSLQPYVFISAENEKLLAELPSRSTTIPDDYVSGPIKF